MSGLPLKVESSQTVLYHGFKNQAKRARNRQGEPSIITHDFLTLTLAKCQLYTHFVGRSCESKCLGESCLCREDSTCLPPHVSHIVDRASQRCDVPSYHVRAPKTPGLIRLIILMFKVKKVKCVPRTDWIRVQSAKVNI